MLKPMRENKRKEDSKKHEQAEKHVVAMIYMATYSQSQLCNWFQRDVANYVHYHGLSDSAMGALHQIGISVGMDKFYRGVRESSALHKSRIYKLVKQALEEKNWSL